MSDFVKQLIEAVAAAAVAVGAAYLAGSHDPTVLIAAALTTAGAKLTAKQAVLK